MSEVVTCRDLPLYVTPCVRIRLLAEPVSVGDPILGLMQLSVSWLVLQITAHATTVAHAAPYYREFREPHDVAHNAPLLSRDAPHLFV